MNVTINDLDDLCAYINERVAPGDEPGPHCDGTPRYTREWLQRNQPSQEHRLDAFLAAGLGGCDCTLLMNFPGVFHDGHERACSHCGEAALVTRDMVHGKGPLQ